MDTTQWYGVALAAVVALSIIFYILRFLIDCVRIYAAYYFLKHVFYPQAHKYVRGSSTTTRFDVLLIIAFLAGNVLCLTIGMHDRTELLQRTGLLSTVNSLPLALGSRMNLIVSRCGVGSAAYDRIHRWIGRVAVIESLTHSILAAVSQSPDWQASSQKAALVAASAMTAILITSPSIVQRYFYEIFLNLHQALAVISVVAIWLHAPGKLLDIPRIYPLVTCCVWASLRILRIGHILYRNIRNWKYSCIAVIESLPDAYQVHVKISRPWKYRAGQYAYLCIPGVSYSALFQSHPYMVSWWYRYGDGHDVVVFIIQRQRGFSQALGLHSSSNSVQRIELRAIIEGPYGKEIHLDEYGTVLLFATGIGIAGQLPYMKQLLHSFHNYDVKARRVALFWQVESEEHLQWVKQWMTELLEEDTEYILDIHIFVIGNYVTKGAQRGMVGRGGTHGRIKITYNSLDVENLIRSEIEGRKGRSVISLCVNNNIGEQVREVVRQMLDKDIHLKELPFHPL